MNYKITADHPTFARPDKIVSGLELPSYKHELELAGFENITVTELRIPEHTVIRTIKQTAAPLYSTGTIVHLYQSGYEVEFHFDNHTMTAYCPEDSVERK